MARHAGLLLRSMSGPWQRWRSAKGLAWNEVFEQQSERRGQFG
jgi:hypothetical protein